MVPPMKFIPIAEDLGLIVEIGEWIMLSACFQVKKMLESGYKQIRCAVNISARQFRSKHLLSCIQGALTKTGIPPELLTIELTESILVKDMNDVIRTLKEISAL
jgi:EAL domain-containing protein (putative c-di-GMP-specific phosphodiesterase class I)